MSVYIGGLEIPPKGKGVVVILCSSGAVYSGGKKVGTAVPVPPHGDLIDRREAIIDANERAYDFWLSDDEVNATIQFLNEQHVVIPAEED